MTFLSVKKIVYFADREGVPANETIAKPAVADSELDKTGPCFGNYSPISRFAQSTPRDAIKGYETFQSSVTICEDETIWGDLSTLLSDMDMLATVDTHRKQLGDVLDRCIYDSTSPPTTPEQHSLLNQALDKCSLLDNSILMLKRLRLVNRGKAIFSVPSEETRSKAVGKPTMTTSSRSSKSDMSYPEPSLNFPAVPTHEISEIGCNDPSSTAAGIQKQLHLINLGANEMLRGKVAKAEKKEKSDENV
uniref:Uncharacterized protein n=1 Tax=Panagrolaimus sp. ES5 TaxID=591445 RepID=A0AC34G3Z9_9BILA